MVSIPEETRRALLAFLKSQRSPSLLTAYLFYLESKLKVKPMVYAKGKTIYSSIDHAVQCLEKEGKIWRETQIKMGFGPPTVNEETTRIYICPFSGKVFGDNTHQNPQDAIYDWVCKTPANTELIGGVKSKKFFVSDDPSIIKNYIKPQKSPVTKTVFSSVVTGKLFHAKETIIDSFINAYLKPITLVEVQNQNKYQMEASFLENIQSCLQEDKVTAFVELLSEDKTFISYINQWLEEEE